MKKIGFVLFCAVLNLCPCFAKIAFENPDLNSNNEILFTLNHNITGGSSYKTLCYGKVNDEGRLENPAEIMTYYPEQMELLTLLDKRVVQVRNRYGTARYYTSTESASWISRNEEIPVNSSVTMPYSVSADGKWFCFIKRTGISSASLVMESVATGKQIELCSDVMLSYNKVPVKWSPEGSILLYEKNGAVYFCSAETVARGIEVEEKYRKIGRGTINSVQWASEKNLVYIDDYLVYRISSRELYTLGLYAGIVGQGTEIGRLPFQFNPAHDYFSVDKDVTAIVVAQENQNFTHFKTNVASCDYMKIVSTMLYSDSKASLFDYDIFWDRTGTPILWQVKFPYDKAAVRGSVIKLGKEIKNVIEIPESGKPVLSPDGKQAAFFAGNKVYVFDINTWEKIASISGEKVLNILWDSNTSLYIGGEKTIRKWNTLSNSAEVVLLSSVEYGLWSEDGKKVLAKSTEDKKYEYNRKNGVWTPYSEIIRPEFTNQNGKFRSFCGTTPNSLFENALYLRTLTGNPVTKPLFPFSVEKIDEKKKVALVFDAYDNSDGLPKIISSLKKYKIPGSFFINGEFIRRYPKQTKQIVINGFECCSMFFAATNLTDSSFIFDEEFIRRGLGRNEDEFYQCTGSELSLYWHAPFYDVTKDIVSAGKAAGYEYIPSQNVHSDIVSILKLQKQKGLDRPDKLIEEYVSLLDSTDGGIVPVTVGVSQGSEAESLCENIDLLINILIDCGFELVPVSKL